MRRFLWLAMASMTMAALAACGGANTGGDLGIVVPRNDVGGSNDVADPGSAPRDVPILEVAGDAGDVAPTDVQGGDTANPQDPGVQDPGGGEDPGSTQDPGPAKDPGVANDPGSAQDPGTSQDPGVPFDPGPDAGLAGGCDPCGLGTVAGKTCAPNVKTAIPYVKVWVDTIDCDGNPQHYQTYSDAKGEYSLQVPCDTQTIYMQKGSFHGAYTRYIDKGMTTVMTSSDGCFPGTAAKIAVITGDWDRIEDTLKLLSLKYTLILGTGGQTMQESQTAINFLCDSAKLNSYDILFLDCSEAARPDMFSTSKATIIKNLKAFVAKGGSVYASDYALPYLTATWPDYILGGAHSAAGNYTYVANVIDTDLAGYLAKTQVSIRYGLGPLTCISGVGGSTHTFIDSTTTIDGGCDGTGMMVSFEPETNGGRVIYTTFHNDEQPTAGGDMESILEYTVFLM